MTELNQTNARTFQFLVTIDSERDLRPQDILEAFESSKTIRLDEDFVIVTYSNDEPSWVWSRPGNPGTRAFTAHNEV